MIGNKRESKCCVFANVKKHFHFNPQFYCCAFCSIVLSRDYLFHLLTVNKNRLNIQARCQVAAMLGAQVRLPPVLPELFGSSSILPNCGYRLCHQHLLLKFYDKIFILFSYLYLFFILKQVQNLLFIRYSAQNVPPVEIVKINACFNFRFV